MKSIAIITIIYNNYSVFYEFLENLYAQDATNFELIVADASENKKTIMNRDIQMTVLPIQNKGYAHGVNKGIEKAQEMGLEKFCVINDDVQIRNDFSSKLEESFNQHPSSAFGGKIYYAKGYEYHDRYDESELGNVLWYAGGISDWDNAWTKHRGVDEVDLGQFDTVEKTEFITGCLFCFDQEIVHKVGMWDEGYFLYYEDADYSERIKRAGIPLIYDPSISIWHKNGQSTDGSGSKLHEKLQRSSHLRYAMKYAPFRTKLHVFKNYLVGR